MRERQQIPANPVNANSPKACCRQQRGTNQLRVADQLASQPQEGLLEVVVGLGRNIIVLEILLSVESNRLSLDFSLLHVDLVAAKNNRDSLADTDKITYKVSDHWQRGEQGVENTYGASWGHSCR